MYSRSDNVVAQIYKSEQSQRSHHRSDMEDETHTKRKRISETSFDSVTNMAENESWSDYLKTLYPHSRDGDCFMDERQHTYYVKGHKYPVSVSGVWGVFFEDFDADTIASKVLTNAERDGLKHIESSVYNLVLYLVLCERVDQESFECATRTERALEGVEAWLHRRGDACEFPFDSVRSEIARVRKGPTLAKPAQRPCYFLLYCLGVTADDVKRFWAMHGDMESFKGTFFHKQVELFLQAMGKRQLESGTSFIPLASFLNQEDTRRDLRIAASAPRTMRALVSIVSRDLWDHPSVQTFLQSQLKEGVSKEFLQFEAWASSRSDLSPFRSEWSIYDEEFVIAGQIDSLWFDTTCGNAIVMADWKRTPKLLSPDVELQQSQVFNDRRGLTISVHSARNGPCAHLYDCPYNHYLCQQNLYAYVLERRYDIKVLKIFLVQCHPDRGGNDTDFTDVELPYDPQFAFDLLAAFQDGWGKICVL